MKQKPLLSLDRIRLTEGRKSLSLNLFPGDAYTIMGRPSSGKSLLLDIIMGEQKPADGSLEITDDWVLIGEGNYTRRSTPMSVLKKVVGNINEAEIVPMLTDFELLDDRNTPISKLSTNQIIGCDLIPFYFGKQSLTIIDGHLDNLDPWSLQATLRHIEELKQEGHSYLIVTSRPDIAEELGNIILMRNLEAGYAGSVSELLESFGPINLTVETTDETTIQTMVKPMTVSVKSKKGYLEMKSHKGQELAAKLLTHGYGTVKSIIVKEPTLEDIFNEF